MNKKKVAIITMHKIINFGSALQAWALQESIKKMGFEVNLIDYTFPNNFHLSRMSKKPLLQRITFKNLSSTLKQLFLTKKYRPIQEQRFSLFWKHRFNLTNKYNSLDKLNENPPMVDYLLTGSDQVWNPNTMYADPAFLLGFGSPNVTRISYAASFSTNIIPEEYSTIYQEYLSRYQVIGVREQTAINLIKKLTNKEGTVVCDPTMLLTQNEYNDLADESKISIDKPYLLAYILDYAYNPRPAINSLIKQISKQLGLHIVYLVCGSTNGYKLGSTTIADAGPNEFVRLFKDAKFVITSSFHGTVFSIIYEKPFYSVLPATGADSRISSLLEKLNLQERGIKANQKFKITTDINLNYSKKKAYIERMRNESLKFLKDNLI